MPEKLVIMPPSFKRKKDAGLLPAIERYDGVLYSVLRNNMPPKGVDVIILTEDLRLIWGHEKIPYREPKSVGKGKQWSGFGPKDIPKEIVERNLRFLKEVFRKKKYDEVFVALGLRLRKAIEGIEDITDAKITYIKGGGLGPYASCLKAWLNKIATREK